MSTFQELHDSDDGMADIEALLEAAGGFVEPSGDLRPRLLESVRTEQRRRRVRTRLTLAAAAVVVAAVAGVFQVTRFGRAMTEASPREQIARAIDDSQALQQARADSGIWSLVDAFWQVREHQASVLHGGQPATPEAASAESADFEAQNATPAESD